VLLVSGLKTDELGTLAYEASLPVLELSAKDASLEQAFLELTAGSEEYRTHVDQEGKK
jgi:ABC-2 type transport system ATP-binding protein